MSELRSWSETPLCATGVGQDGSSLGSWGEGQGIEGRLVHWILGKLAKGHSPHGPLENLALKTMIQQLTGTDEAACRCSLIGLQVLIKRLTGADQLAEKC